MSQDCPLEKPIELMLKADDINTIFGTGTIEKPMSCGTTKLYNFCLKNKIKWRDKKQVPYDRFWLMLDTPKKKIAIIGFLGLDLLKKIAENERKEGNPRTVFGVRNEGQIVSYY